MNRKKCILAKMPFSHVFYYVVSVISCEGVFQIPTCIDTDGLCLFKGSGWAKRELTSSCCVLKEIAVMEFRYVPISKSFICSVYQVEYRFCFLLTHYFLKQLEITNNTT